MDRKSLQELKNEFKRDYSYAVSDYNSNNLVGFNRHIRPTIEKFSKIILFDIIGEQNVRDIEDNLVEIDNNGVLQPQRPGGYVKGSRWIINAKRAFLRVPHFKDSDDGHTSLRKNIDAGFDLLNAQYTESSYTSDHDEPVVIEEDRLRDQSNLCMCGYIALFQSISSYISNDLKGFLAELPKPEDFSRNHISSASYVLERENALSALVEYAHYFKRQDSRKFIAILPENASERLGKNRLQEFFRIKWSLVFDFNPDDASADTLYKTAPANFTHIVTNPSDVTDGTDLTNWVFAKGRSSLSVLNGTSLLRSFPSLFKSVFSKMAKSGTTGDYVIISFYESKENNLLTKAFDKLEDIFDGWEGVENRCHIACLSKNLDFSDKIKTWGEEIGITPSIVPADIKDFLNHIDRLLPANNIVNEKSKFLIRGKSIDISEDINRYRAAGIEFFGPNMVQSTSNDIWDFYSGAEISWSELENDCDARRDVYRTMHSNIVDIIKSNRTNVRIFELKHRPGSGGSTLSRRLAYDIYKEDETGLLRCTVVQIKDSKNIKTTSEYLTKLSGDTDNTCILAIVESKNVSRPDFDNLVNRLAKAKKNILFLYIETSYNRKGISSFRDAAYLDDMLNQEEGRFIAKYKSQGLDESAVIDAKKERGDRSLEVIDFPLLLKEEISTESISSYVSEWTEQLPDNLREFVGYVGFVSHYSQMGLNQNLVRSTWEDPSSGHYSLKGYDEDKLSAIYKLLIEEYSGDVPSGIWRPRYNKFSTYLIKAAWGENWRDRLSEISKAFIQHCSKSGQLGSPEVDMLHSLFIIRRDVDFRAEEVGMKNKFSRLINDLDDKERASSIFKNLVETYPNDAIFHGHYARFLYENASASNNYVHSDDKLFNEAQNQLDIAFELNPYDADLFHMQGMLIRRQLKSLRNEFEHQEERDADYVDDINALLKEWVQDAIDAFDKSIEYDPSSPYGYAASCQLLKEAIEFGKTIKDSSDYSFCEQDSQYTEYVDLLGDKLDQFEPICQSFKENALSQITPSLKIYEGVRMFHRDLIGCSARSVSKYKELYNKSRGEARSIWGDFYVKSILYSKNNTKNFKAAYACLREDERKEIEQVLQRKRAEGDLRCFNTLFNLYRYGKAEYSIDKAIDLLKDCESQYIAAEQNGWGYLNACFYLAVCYSAMAIQANERSSELINNAKKYFDEAKRLAGVFEKSTINAMCYLGDKEDIHCIVDKESEGMLVSGIIISIEEGKGIMQMKCGLEASFTAKKMDRLKYEGKKIQGIIGFKYSGLGLYQFGEVDYVDSSDEEIEDIMSKSYVPDYSDDEDKLESTPDVQDGIKVLGKIDLSAFARKNTPKQQNKTFLGVYNASTDKVRCSEIPYSLEARVKKDNDLYDGADVLFEVDSEPNINNPGKPYKFAINVRIKE